MTENLKIFNKSLLNSYSQVFFSDNRIFSIILILVSFADLYAGLFGLLAVIVTNLCGFMMGFDKRTVSKGLYGFNSLLVGLGLGIYYEPSIIMVLLIVLASIFTLFISVSLQGIIGKYGLPYLSIPFIIGAWIVTLAAREFTSLGISERGIYTLNEIYTLGGVKMLKLYEWWNSIEFARALRIYFVSLGAILFQYNILAGIIISLGLLYHSRIAFTLSLTGFFTAYLFYDLAGASITDLNYSYIGFNYILSSIAIGGFFIIPSWKSYLWSIILVPMVAILTISLSSVFSVFALPVFALPFNIIVLLFIYVLKFRLKPSQNLTEVFIQQNSPEKNLYSYTNDLLRFRHGMPGIKLPFFGLWTVSQAHDGEYTHKGDWKDAWDFVITDLDGKQFRNNGDEPADYYCYGKPVLAVADGMVEFVVDNIPDNVIGEQNTNENWGNSIVIKHGDNLYSSLNHLGEGSVKVKEGQRVRIGDILAVCGNSGRSPYPHLHFQMQSTPYLGSKTLNYPISYYVKGVSHDIEMETFSWPVRDDKISNVELIDLLAKAFDFIPGKEMKFILLYNGTERKESWLVSTDEFNNSFIQCNENGARAYFKNDGNMLLLKHYEGSRKTLLYWFYLALFKLPLGYYPELTVTDEYPLNLFFRKKILFLQDFVAPFFSFLKSKFSLKYINIDNEFSPSSIELKSDSINTAWNRETRKISSKILISENRIDTIEVNGNNINLKAKCID